MDNKTKTIDVEATVISSTPIQEKMDNVVVPTVEVQSTEVATNTGNKNTFLTLDQSGKPDLSKFTPQEIEKFKQKSNSLKTNDNTSILNYGVEVQNNLARSSDSFLGNVRSFDAGGIGNDINDLLTEINYIDIDPTQKSGLQRFLMNIPFLKKIVMNTKKVFEKYDSVSNNVDKIVTKLDKGRISIIKDNTMLDQLFNQNLKFVEDLEELIVGGHIKLDELKAELNEMELNSDNYEDYEIADKRDFIDRLGKRLHDMSLTRMVTITSLPQIRLVQNNNNTMVEKVQSSINTTIPIWKNQLAIAVTLQRQAKIAEVNDKIYNATNTMLTKNAEMLRTNSVSIAQQNERGVVDIEAIRKVQENLIQTIDEIKRIKSEGDNQRKLIAKELETMETGLQDKVLQLK